MNRLLLIPLYLVPLAAFFAGWHMRTSHSSTGGSPPPAVDGGAALAQATGPQQGAAHDAAPVEIVPAAALCGSDSTASGDRRVEIVPAAVQTPADATSTGSERRPPVELIEPLGSPQHAGMLTEGMDGRAAGRRHSVDWASPAALLNAIRRVESGGKDNPPPGDKGLARGSFQIHLIWWLDSGGTRQTYYRDVWNPAKCETRIMALWAKRCPTALASGDLETLARTFRRPCDPWNADNAQYWRRVQGELR